MSSYFIRRFLLIIPTFIGITLISFVIMQFVPGGPVERAVASYRMAQAGEMGAGASDIDVGGNLPEEALQQLNEFYGFDKPIYKRYLLWLGNLLKFNLGESYSTGRPVMTEISQRFPVSIYFGLIGFLLSYLICIPLGIYKAILNGSKFDAITSVLVFIGYSIPGWAAGVILLVLFGGGSFWDVFPLGGITSSNFSELGFFEKVFDLIHHTALPVLCYMLGLFASKTVLMKNSLLENLSQDYVRTAFAKGLDEKVVIFKHAVRNSLIPLATGLGHMFSIILAGSYLIEKVFNIDGIGLLAFNSAINRDYPVAMGFLVIGSLLKLLGNILSDVLYVIIDPRIRFS